MVLQTIYLYTLERKILVAVATVQGQVQHSFVIYINLELDYLNRETYGQQWNTLDFRPPLFHLCFINPNNVIK